MSRRKLRYDEPRDIRSAYKRTKAITSAIKKLELDLVCELAVIDKRRYYVRLGIKSLRGYCYKFLRFTRPQSQRLATLVRRYRAAHEVAVSPSMIDLQNEETDEE
jgi:hypothetical protein